MWNFNLLLITIYVICINFSQSLSSSDDDLEYVSTPLGKVKGSIMKTRLNKTIHAFRGIRYAESPTGDLRFKPPRPVKPWKNIFDASKEGPSCPRYKIESSEDCLRLNVYTTELPTNRNNVSKPVIVFFHPGGFYGFSAQSFQFGPQYLMDKDIVLVTINYRLGSLGFLSTGDSLIPGNMGLKDQVAALKWVRDNIASFGGDPNCVTISGYSAGSWSVILHLVSPMSQGLFHRVIAMSGSPKAQLPTPRHQRNLVTKQANILGCPTENLTEAVGCLKTKPAQEIADSLTEFFEFGGNPILIWRPVIEPELPGEERFLPDHPENLLQEGKFAQIPVITGTNMDEFGGVITITLGLAAKGNFTIIDAYNEQWYRIAPINFMYERETPRSHHISDEIKKFYLNNENVSVSNLHGIANIFTDAVTSFSIHRFVNLVSATNKAPVYYYNFKYPGRYSFRYWPNTTTPYGVVHHDELLYLFLMKGFPLFNLTDPEIITVERWTTIYSHFAKTGRPIPENDELFDKVKWEKYTPQSKLYLDFNRTLTMKDHYRSERMSFWDNLFPVKHLT